MLQEDNRFVLNYQKPITAQHTEKPPHSHGAAAHCRKKT